TSRPVTPRPSRPRLSRPQPPRRLRPARPGVEIGRADAIALPSGLVAMRFERDLPQGSDRSSDGWMPVSRPHPHRLPGHRIAPAPPRDDVTDLAYIVVPGRQPIAADP